MFARFLQWLYDTHFSGMMRESLWAEPVVETIHVLTLTLFLGFAVMIVTGVLLFCGDPISFWSTTFFKVKMIMLALAGLNVLIFNATIGRKVAQWDLDPRTPGQAKIAAVVSLVLWVLIIAAGRGIAYALPPP